MRSVLRAVSWIVLAAGLALQIYLRVYPYFRAGCKWPAENDTAESLTAGSEKVELKVVAFGDPQITGYSPLQKLRKKVDIYGNDLFLKQIASTIRSNTKPAYVAVMGDLLSSQWIPTEEFHARVDRFKMIFPSSDPGQLVNISGNHDIGYHGEFTDERLSRFRERFGGLNYVVKQADDNHDPTRSYRIVVLNSLALDGPPYHDAAQNETLSFLKSLEGFQGSTLLLMHIPLHKPAGICRDGPHFDYYPENLGFTLKQQNHLSANSSDLILNSLFSGGTGGLVVTGHDHEGCFTRYSLLKNGTWIPEKDLNPNELKTIDEDHLLEVKEFTVRSMMGEFGGNAGLITGRATREHGVQWTYTLCRFHIQHIWWIAQIFTIIGLVSVPVTCIL